MRLTRASCIIAVVNIFSLLIVYQRTEVVKYSYTNKRQEDFLQQLSDKRNFLRCQLESYKSLNNINNQLFVKAAEFELPAETQIVTIAAPAKRSTQAQANTTPKNPGVFSKVSSWLEKEAQAESDQ